MTTPQMDGSLGEDRGVQLLGKSRARTQLCTHYWKPRLWGAASLACVSFTGASKTGQTGNSQPVEGEELWAPPQKAMLVSRVSITNSTQRGLQRDKCLIMAPDTIS